MLRGLDEEGPVSLVHTDEVDACRREGELPDREESVRRVSSDLDQAQGRVEPGGDARQLRPDPRTVYPRVQVLRRQQAAERVDMSTEPLQELGAQEVTRGGRVVTDRLIGAGEGSFQAVTFQVATRLGFQRGRLRDRRRRHADRVRHVRDDDLRGRILDGRRHRPGVGRPGAGDQREGW